MEVLRTRIRCVRCVRLLTVALLLLGQPVIFVKLARGQSTERARYRAYELKHTQAENAAETLTEMLSEFSDDIDIVTDSKSNRVLLSGPENVQQLAAKILKRFDQAPAASKPSSADPVVKAYSCPRDKLSSVVTQLKQKFGSAGIKVVGDADGERFLVLAPPESHREIQRFAEEIASEPPPNETRQRPELSLETSTTTGSSEIGVARLVPSQKSDSSKDGPHLVSSDLPNGNRRSKADSGGEWQVKPTTTSSTARDIRPAAAVQSNDENFVTLQTQEFDSIYPMIKSLFLGQLKAVGTGSKKLRLTNAAGTSLEMAFDRKRKGIALSGDPKLCEQISRVLRGLDASADESDAGVQVLPIRGMSLETVEQIHQATQSAATVEEPRETAKTNKNARNKSSVVAANHREEQRRFDTIQLVGGQDAPATPVEADPDVGAVEDQASQLDQPRRRLGADIDVEVLPELDVIILRGNKADVQEMTRILKELERLSIETEPTIEVYPLQHVRGESLAALVEKVTADLTGGLRGKVTVTPLVKPNALLIIGWGESVASVRQLIEKLDKPVTPGTQFQIFRLKHADAQATRTAVQDFFTQRTASGTAATTTTNVGLAPRVQVTADVRTNSLIVQAAPRELLEAAELIEQLDVPGGQVVHQARVFRLKNTLATDLATVLQTAIDAARGKEGTSSSASGTQKSSMLEFLSIDNEGHQILKSGVLSDLKITPEPRTNSLIVSAPADSMDLVAALIKRLDESTPEGAQIKVFRVINGDATSLVQMLRSLLPPPTGPQGAPQLANSRDESALVPARFSIDLRTNSIIATGSAGDLRIVEALLLRLDQRDIEQRKNMVYRLKNAPANAVAKSINDFLRSERTVQQAAPGAISPFQQIESEVVVVPEPVGNSLIISATPRFFEDIERLVEKLDAQPPQVMIQVLIAQVSLNNTNEFGVELGLQDSLLFDRSLLGSLVTTTSTSQTSTPAGIVTSTATNILGATNTPGFAWNGAPLGNSGSTQSLATAGDVAGQAVSNFGVGTTSPTLGYGGLVLSASSESVSVLIRALQQSSQLEVLSRPQIRTLDNQPAFIQIGQRVPRVNSAQVNQIGSVNGVILENVGLILGVTPRISPEGMVVMEVDAEKSEVDTIDPGIPISVSNSGQVIRSPIFNITTASTTVSANSGETIIIGGLITKNTNNIHRRVPYLSDVPVVGQLFRYDSMSNQRTELLIILTPYVIRGPEESARIKREEVARMHWCAGDVFDIYGPGVVEDQCPPLTDREVPVIFPDTNPRGTIEPKPDFPLPPAPDEELRGQDPKRTRGGSAKTKKPGLFSMFSDKKRD